MDLSGTLENVVSQLKEFEVNLENFKPRMDELEEINRVSKGREGLFSSLKLLLHLTKLTGIVTILSYE